MGFVLSVLYFITYYLTPTTIFGPLAVYRAELVLAALVLFVSLPALSGGFIGKTAQTLALLGLGVAVLMSVFVGEGWIGGGVGAFLTFIPNAYAYFLVCLNCNSRKKLQILVLMLLSVCLFVIANGVIELQHAAPINANSESEAGPPYLLAMGNDSGEKFYRLRGLGEINDPNDFGQLTVSVIPLLFIFWRKKRTLQNIVLVLLPVGILLYGLYLTHSRGAMLAILAVTVIAARRKIGLVPSLVLAVGLFVAASALNFTGGREISANAGSDRTALWSLGLQLFKSHPLFGVGYYNFGSYADLTAHNSVVVCVAELGIFGLYFWALFLFATVRDALALSSPVKVVDAIQVISASKTLPVTVKALDTIDRAEVNRLGQLMVLSLTGFLVTGWFLSRAFVMTFFLLGGIVEVIFEMALRQGMISPRMPLTRALAYSGGVAVFLVLAMYILLRTVHFMG